MTVPVAGGVDARLGGRRTCVFSGAAGCVEAGAWATVDGVGAAVCALPATARNINAPPPIVNASNRWKNIFMGLLKLLLPTSAVRSETDRRSIDHSLRTE